MSTLRKKPTAYVTPKYYFEEHSGVRVSERGEFLRLARDAKLKVDALTFNRIPQGGGFDALTEFRKQCVRDAMCYIIDYIAENGFTEGGAVKSFSVLDISVTEGDAGGGAAQMGIPPQARALLLQSGLACRRL